MSTGNKNESFLNSKLFLIIATFVITVAITLFVGWLIVNPMLQSSKDFRDRISEEESINQDILSIRNIEFDPTGAKGYNVTFIFNQNVIESDLVGKEQETQYFSFNPKIPEGGVFVWETRNRLVYKPNNPLQRSTKYNIKLNRNAFNFWKGQMTKIEDYEIQTLRLKVNVSGNSVPSIDSKNTIKYKYNLYFNHHITPEEVKNNTTIKLGNQIISYEVENLAEGSDASQNIQITTQEIDKTNEVQYLDMNVKKEILCLGCTLGMEEDLNRSTRIDQKEYLKLYDIAVFTRENGKQFIRLSLSHQVSVDDIKPYIKIDPKLELTLSDGNYSLELDGNFETNNTYTLSIGKGYEAIYGAIVGEDIIREINMGNLQRSIQLQDPLLKFTAPGIYLPIEKTQTISVNTINVNKVVVEIQKIYSNNLVYFLQDNSYTNYDDDYYYYWYDNNYRIGKTIYSDNIEVESSENMRVYTDINLSEFIQNQKKGIYKVVVRDYDDRWRSSSRWLVATDIGIVSKRSGKDLFVWVNSLKNVNPISNVNVKLISYTNQVIAEGKTDINGIFRVANLESMLKDYTPYAIVAETENDFSFLKLDETRLSTVDFDVSGSYIPDNGIEAYLYMDRDIFRPGDKGNLVSIVRSVQRAEIPEMPVKLKIFNPKNQILHELRSNLDKASTTEFNFDIPSYAVTGYYKANLIMGDDNIIGTYRFQVEDFIPATIEVNIETNQESYAPGESIEATVIGMTLFGPPASDRKVTARYTLNQSYYSAPGYNSYSFGDYKKPFSSLDNSLGEFKLDENGKYVYKISLNKNMTPPSIIKANIQASVFEVGGRAVTRSKSFNIYPYENYIGVKRNSDYYVDLNIPIPFEYVILDKDGKEVKDIDSIKIEVTRSYWVNILKRSSDGNVRYESERREDVVLTNYLSDNNIGKPFIFSAEQSGRYTVTFTTPKDGSSTSLNFYAYSWGGDSFSMEDPDKLIIETDKDVYEVGDVANIIIKSPFAGKLMLSIERESMLFYDFYELKENTANIKIPITKEYSPNAYISGTIIRSIDYVEPFTPVRAFGVLPIKVEQPETKIDIQIKAPEKMEPNNPITIELTLDNVKQDTTRLTVAAVDQGILQLTNYQNPDPHGYFYRKRALEMNTYDLYSFIIPDEDKVKELYSNPGDMMDMENGRSAEDYMQKSSTERVKPTSLWSGIVKLDENKKATVTMDVPEFNGTLRIMAVAVDGNAFGSSSEKTIVRAPIVLSPTFPRFLSIGDEYVIPVGVYNDTGKDGEITVTLSDNNMVTIDNPTQKVFIRNGVENIIKFYVTSTQKLGDVYFTLSAEGNGKRAEKKIEMP
jgi:hypothetical protein